MTFDHASATDWRPASVDTRPDPSQPSGWVERSERATAILLVGRLLNARGDHICRIRNVSSGGMMVECEAALTIGSRVRIEVGNLDAIEAEVVWIAMPRIGVRALSPIDVGMVLDSHRRRGPLAPRSPRLSAAAGVQVWERGRRHSAILRDVSLAGCRIAILETLASDPMLRIVIPGLPPRLARRRWSRDGQSGLAFVEPYPFLTLCEWQSDYPRRFALAEIPQTRSEA